MKCLGLLNSRLHSRSVFWALALYRYNLNNQWCIKACKCVCYNCTWTFRECYWKTDTHWHSSHFFSRQEMWAQEHPMALPIAALPSLWVAHRPFLGNVLSQSLSCPLPQRSPASLDNYQPLMWCSFPEGKRNSYYFPILMPSFLKTCFRHVASGKSNPSTNCFKIKEKEEVVFPNLLREKPIVPFLPF